MHLGNNCHLTYCTNIHPGETWDEIFSSLQTYFPPLKQQLSPSQAMGIGLRLSDQASRTLIQPETLADFQTWLRENDLYVFTMNGFPYGGFHRQVVKDHVYAPDWTAPERLAYTLRLCDILAQLLPEGMDGGISTSPVSYKPWFSSGQAIQEALQTGAMQLIKVVAHLMAISLETGKIIHIDIEPEPDCLLENTRELIDFFAHHLLPTGAGYLMGKMAITHQAAEEVTRTHLRVCYDVCHFAVEYEPPIQVLAQLQAADIRVGKIQISAALKAALPATNRTEIAERFTALSESTYLHQVVVRNQDESFTRYMDLPQALPHIHESQAAEWRTHFHVPVFVADYQNLQSTRDDIVEVLRLNQLQPFTSHLEVETYTWEVLPETLKIDLATSIRRELEWVLATLRTNSSVNG